MVALIWYPGYQLLLATDKKRENEIKILNLHQQTILTVFNISWFFSYLLCLTVTATKQHGASNHKLLLKIK